MCFKMRNFLAINSEGEIEYKISYYTDGKTNKYYLYTSDDKMWGDEKNTLLLSMIDKNDCCTLNKNHKVLNYPEMEYLRILLNFEYLMSCERTNIDSKYKIIELNDDKNYFI